MGEQKYLHKDNSVGYCNGVVFCKKFVFTSQDTSVITNDGNTKSLNEHAVENSKTNDVSSQDLTSICMSAKFKEKFKRVSNRNSSVILNKDNFLKNMLLVNINIHTNISDYSNTTRNIANLKEGAFSLKNFNSNNYQKITKSNALVNCINNSSKIDSLEMNVPLASEKLFANKNDHGNNSSIIANQ